MKYSLGLLCLMSVGVFADYQEIFWEDLVPQDYTAAPQAQVFHDGQSMAQIGADAPVVESFDGMKVKVPGFVVPLEGDRQSLRSFLLVPYFGACVHVPPPPANQIIHVTFEAPTDKVNLQDAVWVSGTLSTEGWSGNIATVGYQLTGVKIEPYQ